MTLLPASVRARVTLAATAAIVVVLGAVGWGLVVNHRRELTDSLDERMSELLDGVAADVRAGDPAAVDELGEDDWVVQVVVDGGDVAAASSSITGLAALPSPARDQEVRTIDPLPGLDDDRMRLLSRVVDAPNGTAVVHVAAPADDIDESVIALRRSLLVAIPIAAATLAVLTWLLVGRTLRPVERIRAEVSAIGAGDLDRRVPVPAAHDEIARLATTMNEMLGRLEQAQERQRRFVADASHELRSPLARMRTELEVDLAHPATADPAATHRSVLDEVEGLQQLVDDLLLLARSSASPGRPGASEAVDLGALARHAVTRPAGRDGIDVRLDVADASTTGSFRELARAVDNLVDNAVRHARTSVVVRVHGDGDSASIVVQDDGPGIPPLHRERIFERFARVDDARSADDGGAGLGLSIAREIVERHGGTLVVDVADSGGARFVITVPSIG